MKKNTLILMTLSLGFMSYAQFPETFDTEIPSSWAIFIGTNGEGTVQNWEQTNGYAFSGFEDVPTSSEDWLVTPQVMITASNPILAFDFTDYYSTNYSSNFEIRISTGVSQTTHSDFETVATLTEFDVIANQFFDPAYIDLSAYIGLQIYIAFVHVQDDGDIWFLDNVDLIPAVNAPNPTINPTPSDGATNVYIDPTDGSDADIDPDNIVVFSWNPSNAGDPADSFNFYFGNSASNMNLIGNTENNLVNLQGLEYSTTYYWQVVAINSGGEASGSEIWSFTTQANPNLGLNDVNQNTFSYRYIKSSSILELESSNTPMTSVEIYSTLGQNVLSKSLTHTKELIDLSSLNNGIYLAKVYTDGQSKTIKFIKS